MNQDGPKRKEHPLLFATFSIGLAVGFVALTLFWAYENPERVLIGLPGRHDTRANASASRLAQCLDCHVPFVGTPGTRCLGPGCHGDLATGTPPKEGPAMPVRFHVALREHPCGTCHQEHTANPARTSSTAAFEHAIIPSKSQRLCSRCHSGAKMPNHAKTNAVSCDLCHQLDRFKGARMIHGRVASHPCDLCHVAPPTEAHASVAGTCSDCHVIQAWGALR